MKQKVRIAGTYLQNEWKNERWSLLVGGRLDKHNLVDHVIFSPRANLRFNPNRSINCVPAMPEASVLRKLRRRLTRQPGGRRTVSDTPGRQSEGRAFAERERVCRLVSHYFGDFQVNMLLEGFYTKLS